MDQENEPEQQRIQAHSDVYSLLAANVEDFGMFITDTEGLITAWNPGAERILGWRESEVVGQPTAIIFTPEDRANKTPETELEKARTAGCADDVRWHLRKDGSRFFADGVLTALKDDAGNLVGFGKVLRDATKRKRYEDELRSATQAQHALHRQTYTILESISDAFYALDSDFRFTYVNRVAEEWWGRRREDLIGKHCWTEFPAAVGSDTYERHREVMVSRQPVHYETVSPLVKHWVDINIHPAEDGGLSVYFKDITERKRSEQALRAAWERERTIAHVLQRPLTLTPEPDAFPGLAVATCYEPRSSEADGGGDFFDVFELPRGRVCLAVADASGKGLQAAARAIQAKEVLRAFTREYPHSPAHIAARINDYLFDNQEFDNSLLPGELFVTLVLVVLDPHTGEAAVVSAGAESALVIRASGKVEVVPTPGELSGMPLGVQRSYMYYAVPIRIAPGDTLLLTTDGITEARRNTNTFLGLEGVAELAREALATEFPLQSVADTLVEKARQFGNGQFRDDVCLLLARRR